MNSAIRIIILTVIVLWSILLTIHAHSETVDFSFKAAMAYQIATTTADGFTTANWDRSKCNVEVSSPWLYGRNPSTSHLGLTMAVETAGFVALGYVLKRKNAHIGRVKLWSIPMLASGSGHLAGTIHNLRRCQ